MTSLTLRHKRLLELLPPIYSTQPADSAVGGLLASMAHSLQQLDAALQRVRHDHWVALASGDMSQGEASALDQLGALLHLYRLPARIQHLDKQLQADGSLLVRFKSLTQRSDALACLVGSVEASQASRMLGDLFQGLVFDLPSDTPTLWVSANPQGAKGKTVSPQQTFLPLLEPEPAEMFRERLRITAAIMAKGLNTPKSILSLAIAALGAYPCPKVESDPAEVNAAERYLKIPPDTTSVWGMPPAIRKQCKACTHNDKVCPHREKAVVKARLIDQPLQPSHARHHNLYLHKEFRLFNQSLWADRPVLKVQTDSTVTNLAFRNLTTGETLAFKGSLHPGQTLSIYPVLDESELEPFQNHERIGHHHWDTQRGKAELKDNGVNGVSRQVNSAMRYLAGSRFDAADSVFGAAGQTEGLRFAWVQRRIKTPQLLPNENRWVLLTLPDIQLVDEDDYKGCRLDEVEAVLGEVGKNRGIRFASQPSLHTPTTDAQITLECAWVSRPTASFRVTIPRNDWVQAAEHRGALELVRSEINRAKPAGVRAWIDFPEPVREEFHATEAEFALSVKLNLTEAHEPVDPVLVIKQVNKQQEFHEINDTQLGFGALFDVTRWDWSRLE